MTFWRDKAWFWLPILPLVLLDLWSKSAVFGFLAEEYPNTLPIYRSHPVWSLDAPVTFQLVCWRNTGTIWGLGQDLTTPLIVLRFVALVLIVVFAARLPAAARLQQFVLGLVMAGAIGNLYDNLTEERSGVRDFLLFSAHIGGELRSFPAFNVADSCICVGAITLAVLLWRADAAAAQTA